MATPMSLGAAPGVILVDTGPLVAAALSGDANHVRCTELFTALHLNNEALLVPALVVTEVCYLLEREAGPQVEVAFPLGAVDASVIAIAERLGITEVATLDRRHFTVVRPRGICPLALLPE